MSSEILFVWIYLPEETSPVVAGRLNIRETPTGPVGEFVYGQSYLARSEAVPLDPVSLPIINSAPPFTSLSGFPGAVLDACPDRWGIKIIDRLQGKKTYPGGYRIAFICRATMVEKDGGLISRQINLVGLNCGAGRSAVEA